MERASCSSILRLDHTWQKYIKILIQNNTIQRIHRSNHFFLKKAKLNELQLEFFINLIAKI